MNKLPLKRKFPSVSIFYSLTFVLLMVGCYIVFSVLQPVYGTVENLYSMFLSSMLPSVLALSMGVVISAGGFDLSIGHAAGFSALMCGYLLREMRVGTTLAILLAILCAVAIGAFNGLLVARLGISSFIATLSMQFVLTGIRQWITKGDSYRANQRIRIITQGETLHVSNLLIVSLFLIVLVGVVMQKTSFGRRLQFVGSNIVGSSFNGINVRLYTFLAFLISGAIAGAVGVLQFSKLTSATINIGDGWMFDAMTIAVFSSVIFGRFHAGGIVLVSMLLMMIQTGINMLGVSSAWTDFVLGLILLLALFTRKVMNITRTKKSK